MGGGDAAGRADDRRQDGGSRLALAAGAVGVRLPAAPRRRGRRRAAADQQARSSSPAVEASPGDHGQHRRDRRRGRSAAVDGAPGDGSQSLSSALRGELTRNGVQVAEHAQAGAYRIEGKVTVGQAASGKQPIQIDWQVKDPQGKKLGTVSQKNEIAQGSLDGAWGETADAAAAAAAQGIVKLLPAQGKTRELT